LERATSPTAPDIANADSSRMGAAAEHLVAASCIIQSRARLNVSTSLVDDEGVDLVFHRRQGTATLAVQVKARMDDSRVLRRGRFTAQVRSETLNPRRDLYVLFLAVKVAEGTFDTCWLVPSIDLAAQARQDGHRRYVFSAALKDDSKDKWSRYKVSRRELPDRILALLGAS
jgi:hypothetical protein